MNQGCGLWLRRKKLTELGAALPYSLSSALVQLFRVGAASCL
uniref:Uncharacterized protein n=1 Tax=Arundo donax TaxID=35708 RepID=A0A0A9FFD3_ARUDO